MADKAVWMGWMAADGPPDRVFRWSKGLDPGVLRTGGWIVFDNKDALPIRSKKVRVTVEVVE